MDTIEAEKIAVQVVSATVVHPGDTLIVNLDPERSSMHAVKMVEDHLCSRLPETVRVCVMGGAIELYVLRSGEAAEPRST